MKTIILALLFSFLGCKAQKVKTHPLMRTDGFYYRHKAGDLYQLVRFYNNGRVAVSRKLAKEGWIPKFPNAYMCYVDSAITRFDLGVSSYTIKNDSVFFVKKPDDQVNEPYNVKFAIKLHTDNLMCSLKVVDYDSSMNEKFTSGSLKFKQEITRSFTFVKAATTPRVNPTSDSTFKSFVIPKKTENGQLVMGEL